MFRSPPIDSGFGARLGSGIIPALCVLAASGCGKAPAPLKVWPPDTVLALNGTPITAAEVDAVGAVIAKLEPEDALQQLRRIALTNAIFPLMAAREADRERRARVLAQAEEYRRNLDRGPLPEGALAGPTEKTLEGGLVDIGLETWGFAIEAPIGRWSDPIETVGAFEIVAVRERSQGQAAGDVRMKVAVYLFPYLDSDNVRKIVEGVLDHSKLEFVDEHWRDVVPTAWQYRLRGGTP